MTVKRKNSLIKNANIKKCCNCVKSTLMKEPSNISQCVMIGKEIKPVKICFSKEKLFQDEPNSQNLKDFIVPLSKSMVFTLFVFSRIVGLIHSSIFDGTEKDEIVNYLSVLFKDLDNNTIRNVIDRLKNSNYEPEFDLDYEVIVKTIQIIEEIKPDWEGAKLSDEPLVIDQQKEINDNNQDELYDEPPDELDDLEINTNDDNNLGNFQQHHHDPNILCLDYYFFTYLFRAILGCNLKSSSYWVRLLDRGKVKPHLVISVQSRINYIPKIDRGYN
ncbi:hypothetical protein DICPUDRAFT_75228 [Dictyostelium purpureum]|uniref:Uncharacterized protein n=1 Tax=Dictyostelium purpureum TaxID=5786 RepID=F0ZA18_DICPU|nr:uncharacterized protein DICPUDRAFT_75228 [Dictyostelium purpureum]EGC39216.1 hypothetical protein DICPUDRAFT_75228 [Dictyostelium purpureum]|eukprot:XP_003284243.1 hypothetical protein DICPUDRAFT_75228 [Dictyostelium purpureum]